ncbi:Zinc finger and BTB domain-containing protein 41 [Orchesella cincta]|uniref:Zinc finger and BTB domain-containing protein 41 n=1 Tax=Orchesella cincta TaxID=48709 RepID=A0A1D2MCW9_ORCCI|nr:Zinc finger and BTB domain-containing protein 41 [Orchesella cincta]
MPEVQVQQMKISKRTPGLSLPASSHPARQSDFQVEYIFVEREDESFPVDTHDDYDNDFPSSDPLPSPQPSNTEEALPKSFQKALDLLPTKNYHGRDLKPKKKYKKKLPDVEEPLQKRRKTVVNKSYAEVDEFKDLPPPRSWIAYIKKKKKSSEDEEDEYVPPEKTEPPSTKFKEKVKTRKITFFSCLLTKVEDSSSEETFKCSKCDAILPNRWDMLRAHVVKEHTDRLVCSECGEKFGRLAYLKAHLKKKHQNAAQPVLKTPCHVCGRPCDATYMKTHRWTHYSEEERDAALARGEKLPYRKNKKFQCDQCEKRFYSMDILKAHTKKVHEGIPLPPAKRRLCPDCGADVRNLAQHIRQKHSDYGKRKFACITCDKRFVSQNDLRQHKFQAHGNEKPYQCEVCGRGFKTRQNMEQHHTNVHVNAKVYQCPHCPMKFTNKRVWFERHIVAKHGGGDGTISQPNQRVEYEQEEQKLNVEQLQAVNLCQQDFGGGVVPMSNLHPFY